MKRVSVAIVEPSPIILEGVSAVVSHSPALRVVCTAASVSELVPLLRTADVDVVIAAVGLARDIEGATELQAVPIVGMQSAIVEPNALRRFVSVATLYTAEEELHRIICDAADAPTEHNYADSHELSERERDVLILVAKGLTNKEIASELNISPHTVISHRKNIVHKTGIRSVAGLTVYAVLNKLIDSDKL